MGFVHLEGQSLYFAKAASLDILVGNIKDGALEAADATSEHTSDGIHSASGQVYTLDVNRGQGMQIRVHGDAENFNERTFSLPLPGVLSAVFLGENQKNEFYVQTEVSDGETVSLAVQKIGSDGKLLETIKIPANDYAVATTKLLVTDKDGGVIQFLPQINQAVLQTF
jgi:predicted RNA-binding protein with TRAM domain